jgi:hypothetical protein
MTGKQTALVRIATLGLAGLGLAGLGLAGLGLAGLGYGIFGPSSGRDTDIAATATTVECGSCTARHQRLGQLRPSQPEAEQ